MKIKLKIKKKINAKNVNLKTLFLFYIHQCFQRRRYIKFPYKFVPPISISLNEFYAQK